MPERQHATTEVDELVEELAYFGHQSLSGHRRGKRALEELLYRAGVLPDDHWSLDATGDIYRHVMESIQEGPAFVTVQQWLDDEGYDVDLAQDPVSLDGLMENDQ